MRIARPVRPWAILAAATAFALVTGGSAAQAQSDDPVAVAFCSLYTAEEIESVLGTALAATPNGDECTWATPDGGLTSASAGWYELTIADHKGVWPEGTDHTIGGRTAWFSPGMFLQEMLIELEPGVLHLVITGYDGDVEAALLELGELAVARADSLIPPAPDPTMPPMDGDPELEALFPPTIGGETLVVQSMAGTDFISDPEDVAEVNAALASHGKTLDDVSFGIAILPTGTVTAIKVAGADAAAFAEAVLAGTQGGQVEMVPAQVAGKDVMHLPAVSAYAYPSGDVLWVVQLEEPALSEVLTALP
jgi:hypothetical protein